MTAKLSLAICLSGLLVMMASGCRSTCCTSRTAPAVYKVAFENEQIRVIEYYTGSEKGICGYGMHTHPPHAYIMLTDAKLRIVTPDGKEIIESAKAGDVGWADREEHIAENLSGNNAGCYVIEIKGKDWKPSTGLTK